MGLKKSSMGQALSFNKKTSSNTITNYYYHFCQLMANMIVETDIIVGGPGIEVEIDESKFAKRKYH